VGIDNPSGQLPPPPGPTRPPPKPFGRWAAQNPFKVAVAVLGGLVLNVASIAGPDLLPWDIELGQPPDAAVLVLAKPDVCWKVSLNFGREIHKGCGNAHYELTEMTTTDIQPVRYRAQIFESDRWRDGVVRIRLVVDGELRSKASTRQPSATFVTY
jgi:hypothetical protein